MGGLIKSEFQPLTLFEAENCQNMGKSVKRLRYKCYIFNYMLWRPCITKQGIIFFKTHVGIFYVDTKVWSYCHFFQENDIKPLLFGRHFEPEN